MAWGYCVFGHDRLQMKRTALQTELEAFNKNTEETRDHCRFAKFIYFTCITLLKITSINM